MPHPTALQHIPMPVLYGVFLHMGVTALNSIQVREGGLHWEGVLWFWCFWVGRRGFAQQQLPLRSTAWISALCGVQPGTELSPTRPRTRRERRDLSRAKEREKEGSGMLRSSTDLCTAGSGGLGEVGPVDNTDLLSKPQGAPHLGAAGRAGTGQSFGSGIAAHVPVLFFSQETNGGEKNPYSRIIYTTFSSK